MEFDIKEVPHLGVSSIPNEVFVNVGNLLESVSVKITGVVTIYTSTLFPVTGSVTDLAPLTVEVGA